MSKLIRILCGFLTAIFVTTGVYAESTIISVNSFTQITALIEKNKDPHHLLLAVDDDDTLTMMPCPTPSNCQYLGGPSWWAWHSRLPKSSKERIWKTFPELLNIADFLYNSSKMVLDDPAIPTTLKTVSARGAHVIVVTDRGYRMAGATENQFTHDRILNAIEKSAVKTKQNHISYPGFYFPKKWGKDAPRHIAYLHGVLYVSGQNKGDMIKQLLTKTNETKEINAIIFVDDTLQNVKDVANAYKNNPAVDVIAVHFTRLAAHKAAFLKGKKAKKLQNTANKQWYAIRTSMRKNLPGFIFN